MKKSGLVRIVSDLHLGHPASRVESVEQLLPLLDGVSTLVVNGDACEQRYRGWKSSSDAMMDELRDEAVERGVDLIFLRGNHDPWVSDVDWLELDEGRLLVTHGDALFRHLSPWSPKVMKLRDEMDEIWEQADESSAEAWFAAVQACRVLKPHARDEVDEMQGKGPLTAPLRLAWPLWRVPVMLWTWWVAPARAAEFCERLFPKAKTVVFGHTHWPGVWRRRGRRVINTGGYVSVGGSRVVDFLPESGELVVRKVKVEAGALSVRY